jgi:hypothetical protein
LLAQICLKSVIKDLWTLFYALQIVCQLNIYSVAIPGNAEIMTEQLLSLIEFEMLNPEGLVKIFIPSFTLKDWLAGQKKALITSKD